jgi:hypothetical protein
MTCFGSLLREGKRADRKSTVLHLGAGLRSMEKVKCCITGKYDSLSSKLIEILSIEAE